MSLFTELKRRNVFRVAIAYGVIAWVLAQVADLAFDNFGAPDWVSKSVLFILILGFPLAVLFAWAYELTPDGIKREKDVDRSDSVTAQTGRKLNHLIIGVLVVAVGLLLFDRLTMNEPVPAEVPTTSSIAARSIAVLPFDNRSNRTEDEFFTEGIHDDLLTTMANIGSMRVISRTSVMEYKDTTKKIPEIAKELGVANILEGGVQRAGNQVRINVQLIDAATDEHLWAEIYDRELTAENLFAIQSEVSQAIANALHATLSPEEAQRVSAVPTENLEAYETYLLGRQRWEKRTAESTAQAVDLFLKAIELDPNFAEAWAGLGDAYRHQVPYGGVPGYEAFPRAEEAIVKALELNPDLAEAHAARGALYRQSRTDNGKAIEHLERAIELNPSYAPAYNWLGLSYNDNAQFDKATEVFLRGQAVDPLSAIIAVNLASTADFDGRHDEFRMRAERLVETHPELPGSHLAQASYHLWVKGRFDRSLQVQLRGVLADPDNPAQRVFVANMLRNLGDQQASDRWMESAFELQPDNMTAQLFVILGQVESGDIESATTSSRQLLSNFGPVILEWEWIGELLADADIAAGNVQTALDRYAEAFPWLIDPNPQPLTVWDTEPAMAMVRLLRLSGDAEQAASLLQELTRILERSPIVGSTGSGFYLAAAYAMAGRDAEALRALRAAIDAGYRVTWKYYFDYHWSLESLRDDPEFQSMRMEIAANLEKQAESARRMEAAGELPHVPGMELFTKRDTGAPPI
jgi:TolB-like protein/predicted Zn-dependent protease